MPRGVNRVTTEHRFPSRQELLARYEDSSQRRLHDVQFYCCLAVWKLAIICEGLYAHYLNGTAPNPQTADMEWRVPQLVRRLHRLIKHGPWEERG